MILNKKDKLPRFLECHGEMAQIIGNKNWTNTALGRPENWPLSLKFAVGTMLRSAYPKFIWWGEDLICFYNDAYRPSLGNEGKHPFILGQSAREAWPEIWNTIKPLIDQVWQTGKPVWMENQLIPIFRNGKIENVYWTFSYSAILGDDENIGGILVTCTETTQAVTSLKKLEESQDLLSFAVDAAELGTWDYNPQTNKFIGNERLKQWFGLQAEDNLELSSALEAILPEDRNNVMNAIQEAIKGTKGGKYDVTYTIVNLKNHNRKVVRALGRAWFNENYEAYRFNGTLQDVSEQVRSVEELRIANDKISMQGERFKSIIRHAPVGIALFRGQDHFVEIANIALLQLVDRNHDEFVGKNLFEAVPEMVVNISPLFQKIREDGKSVRGTEYKVPVKRKGKIQDAYFDFILHPINGNAKGELEIMVVANEVTDYVLARNTLAENESQFRNLVIQSPIAMAIFRGEDFRIEMANQRILNHFWNRSLNDVIGKRLLDVFPELEKQKFADELKSVLHTGKAVRDKASKAIVVTGGKQREFYVDYNYLPLNELDGTVSGIIITVTDVTDQYIARKKLVSFSKDLEKQVKERTELLRKTNEKLQLSVKKLENANAELESFAFVSSHDLQEPLRKIQMYTSRIIEQEQTSLTDNAKKYFDKITLSAQRMRTLIDDLLAFSRTGEGSTEFKPTDLNAVVDQVLDNFSSTIENVQATIQRSNLPTLRAVPFQMRQVFSNLIGNSLKFVKENVPPKIEINWKKVTNDDIRTMNLTENTPYFKITVTDNGIGIPKGMEKKIFEVFQRTHAKHEFEGTGIGLAIVRKIIDNHGGVITAMGNEGKGAVFVLYLPQ